MTFEIVKRNYDRNLWSKVHIKLAVTKGIITTEQYKEITKEDYVE